MSNEDERMLREELRAAVNEKDYTSAVAKAEEMAAYYEQIGDTENARAAWKQAATLFFEWAQAQRRGRTHKNSAKSLANAADIFGKLDMEAEAAQAISLAAQDLVLAGEEYLVWQQPLGAGVCYATAAILFILVSQEDKAEGVIEQVRTRLDALRVDSSAVSLVEIPNQLKYAKDQLDSRLLNNVKTLVYSSLIPALTNSGLSEFTSYIERTILGVETLITSSIQYPMIEYEIKMKGEVAIGEPFDIEVLVMNRGSGPAYDVVLEMVPKKEVTIVRDFSRLKANEIGAGAAVALTWRCIVKSEDVLQETQEITLSARISFTDPKNMRQSLTVGPIVFSTVSLRERDQLRMELRLVRDSVQKTREAILPVAAAAGSEVVNKILDILEQLMDQAEGFIDVGAVQKAKAWSDLIQLQLELMNEIPKQIKLEEE